MVDRIVPTPADPLRIVTERFSQWVIEDFDGPRPDWDAQFVPDSRPYELMKLRLLNGSHTALAALGLPKGHTTVAEAIADPELEAFVRRLLDEELLPTVPPVPGVNLADYVETMIERFRNPHVEHPLTKIAAGAEDKIAQRLVPAARELDDPVLINQVISAAQLG
jgi:fructuronate reductase